MGLDSLANAGRRGPKKGLEVIFKCCNLEEMGSEVDARDLISFCNILFLSAELLIIPPTLVNSFLPNIEEMRATVSPLVDSLLRNEKTCFVSLEKFDAWSEKHVPVLPSTLSTYLQN